MFTTSPIQLKPITEKDIPFLYEVYKSTRLEELTIANFSKEELENFLKMQFNLQHTQYMKIYKNADFDIIYYNNSPVGRLYVARANKDIRIIDIALLTNHRKKGIGKKLISDLIKESEKSNLPLSLHVEKNNPILPFYKRIGFKELEDRNVYFFMERLPNVIGN